MVGLLSFLCKASKKRRKENWRKEEKKKEGEKTRSSSRTEICPVQFCPAPRRYNWYRHFVYYLCTNRYIVVTHVFGQRDLKFPEREKERGREGREKKKVHHSPPPIFFVLTRKKEKKKLKTEQVLLVTHVARFFAVGGLRTCASFLSYLAARA